MSSDEVLTESHEVLKEATSELGVKAIAQKLKVSPALVYKWCEPPPDDDDPDQSGARNPLDRVLALYLETKDPRIIRWVCNGAGGFFVKNPEVATGNRTVDQQLLHDTQRMVREFSELLDAVTRAVEEVPGIQPKEAKRIRHKWEELKACVERFVHGCERGLYDTQPPANKPGAGGKKP